MGWRVVVSHLTTYISYFGIAHLRKNYQNWVLAMKISNPQFKSISAHNVPNDWSGIAVGDCYRFRDGFVQFCKSGYWFPYEGDFNVETLRANLTRPHVLCD